MTSTPSDPADESPFMPPRWFVRTAWIAHRALYRGTGGRRGLWPPKPGKWGTMRLVTIGRKSGKEREAIVAYFADGPNIVTMAMNGWGEGEPAWWLNLLDHPDAEIELKGEGRTRAVRGRPAEGAERERLWEAWRGYTPHLDALFEAALDGDARSSSSSRAPIDAPRRRRVDSYPTKSLGYRGHDPDRIRDRPPRATASPITAAAPSPSRRRASTASG